MEPVIEASHSSQPAPDEAHAASGSETDGGDLDKKDKTDDPTDTEEDHKIETCSVPECPEKARDFTDEAEELATEVEAVDCECGDQLYGSSQTTKDTSVLVQSKKGKKCKCKKAH